jgi:type II secretory pathway pseudopilin PulG
MAVVLVILGLLLAALLVPLSAQIEQRNISQTQKTLADIKDALTGYAVLNGRLPCPASSSSLGQESPVGGGGCTNLYDGFVPGVTLGINPTDSQGFVIDGWGNPIHYAVTSANSNAYTTTNGIKTAGFASVSPNLYVCSSATGVTAMTCGTATSLTTSAPAVIYSIGKNGLYAGTGLDEAQNPNPNSTNNDRVFISHEVTGVGAANGEFDDMVTWLSNSILINRMLTAGQLP